MAKEFFMMKAHKYTNQDVGGWLWSEKLDGNSAFWDGGITRGLPKDLIPWANTDKDERFKEKQYSTGLWTPNGNVFHAPDWWLKQMPKSPACGELWNGTRSVAGRQRLRSTVSGLVGDRRWEDVKLMAFTIPCIEYMFRPREIDTAHYKKRFTKHTQRWMMEQMAAYNIKDIEAWYPFGSIVTIMKKRQTDNMRAIEQNRIPYYTHAEAVDEHLTRVLELGGEGLMLRHKDMPNSTMRDHMLLKVKYAHDAEAKVVGYTAGRGRLLGKMGALIVEYNHMEFELSGMTDDEREMYIVTDKGITRSAEDYLKIIPGLRVIEENDGPANVKSSYFPLGSTITFKYRAKSRDGVPQEARYWRRRYER